MLNSDRSDWDKFSSESEHGSPYLLSGWAEVVSQSYAHNTRYFVATQTSAEFDGDVVNDEKADARKSDLADTGGVVGILPLVHIRHWLFGNSLVSMPFCDAGGILASSREAERSLVEHCLKCADSLRVPVVDLRQYQALDCLNDEGFSKEVPESEVRTISSVPGWSMSLTTDRNKVRMLLDLPGTADALMQSFKAKLRSQVRKPIKDGLTVKSGGADLLADFYDVFATNMRDLGSPVHSKQFIHQVLLNFPTRARIFIVYGNGVPMACSMTLGSNGVLCNPWASALRRYSQLAPNMLLYWAMLEYACEQGYQKFDFGRSTVDEGTYRFKEQWGAKPMPLYWYRFGREGQVGSGTSTNGRMMSRASEYWKRLPVPVSRVLGPKIRQYISL
jgi:FemAB-related protein (PEP-CTERM system-associated)